MSIAICPGSFDPITLGHLNIIRRTSRIFDKVVVCIMYNSTKTAPMFSVEERVDMVKRSVARYPNVTVDTFDGLLAEFSKQYPGAVLVKGLRAASDFEYEFFLLDQVQLLVHPESKFPALLTTLVPKELFSSFHLKIQLAFDNNYPLNVVNSLTHQFVLWTLFSISLLIPQHNLRIPKQTCLEKVPDFEPYNLTSNNNSSFVLKCQCHQQESLRFLS